MTELELWKIRRDGGTQSRDGLNEETITDYVALLDNGGKFKDDVIVYYDGQEYWLADGFHRTEATERHARGNLIPMPTIGAEIRQGTLRDAVWHSLGANQEHGLRRSTKDKQNAIARALSDPDWRKLSDREIARHIGVDHKTVSAQRERMTPSGEIPQMREVTRNGATYTMKKPEPAVKLTPLDMLAAGENGHMRYIDPKALKDMDSDWITRYDQILEKYFRHKASAFYLVVKVGSEGYIAWNTQAERIIRDLRDNSDDAINEAKIIKDNSRIAVLLPAQGKWLQTMSMTGTGCYLPAPEAYHWMFKKVRETQEASPEPEPEKPGFKVDDWVESPKGERLQIKEIHGTSVYFYDSDKCYGMNVLKPVDNLTKLEPGDLVLTRTGRQATVIDTNGLIVCQDSTGTRPHKRETLKFIYRPKPAAPQQTALIEPDVSEVETIGTVIERLMNYDEYGSGDHSTVRDINFVRVWLNRMESRAKADIEIMEELSA